jgi:hypothetical protein
MQGAKAGTAKLPKELRIPIIRAARQMKIIKGSIALRSPRVNILPSALKPVG